MRATLLRSIWAGGSAGDYSCLTAQCRPTDGPSTQPHPAQVATLGRGCCSDIQLSKSPNTAESSIPSHIRSHNAPTFSRRPLLLLLRATPTPMPDSHVLYPPDLTGGCSIGSATGAAEC